jgi:murein DD-endopeptidase MepM/ murein hydrolase activator NlpD
MLQRYIRKIRRTAEGLRRRGQSGRLGARLGTRLSTRLSGRLSRRLSRRLNGRLLAAGLLALALGASAFSLARGYRERASFLYYPRDWGYRGLLAVKAAGADNLAGPGAAPVGGAGLAVLPVDVKRYVVKEGDTLSGIAERLALDLDTVASLNRHWGSGVHLVRVGEEILVPNQDGIYLPAEEDLAKMAAARGVPLEAVLAANRLQAGEVQRGQLLFFPGVQHHGIERSVVIGTAFLRPVLGWTSSPYGYRRDPFTNVLQFHRGVDIAAPAGSAVRAALDGRVTLVAEDPVLGLYILLRHQIGYSTVYGHLQQALVRPGEAVARGQRIGLVGSSGKTTGPHLHFEVRKSGRPVNTTGLLSTRR